MVLLALASPGYLGWVSVGIPLLGFTLLCVAATFSKPRFGALAVAALVLSTLLCSELLLLALMSSPKFATADWALPISRSVHNRFWRVMQWESGCAEFDSQLFYRFREEGCSYSDVQFSTTVRANSLGARDDESSLEAPVIAVLGDSYSAGWGIEEGETYAAQLERLTGHKTLNLAVSSYAARVSSCC